MRALEKESRNATGTEKPMDRRKFCASCFSCTSGMILLSYPGIISGAMAVVL